MYKRKIEINVVCFILGIVSFCISCSMNYFIGVDDIIFNIINSGVFLILGLMFLFLPNIIFKNRDESKQKRLTRILIYSSIMGALFLLGILFIIAY